MFVFSVFYTQRGGKSKKYIVSIVFFQMDLVATVLMMVRFAEVNSDQGLLRRQITRNPDKCRRSETRPQAAAACYLLVLTCEAKQHTEIIQTECSNYCFIQQQWIIPPFYCSSQHGGTEVTNVVKRPLQDGTF